MSETASLTIDGKSIELPLVRGTEDEVACDISALRGQTGTITIDPGYGNTGSCKSAVTYLDGEHLLRHERCKDLAQDERTTAWAGRRR